MLFEYAANLDTFQNYITMGKKCVYYLWLLHKQTHTINALKRHV